MRRVRRCPHDTVRVRLGGHGTALGTALAQPWAPDAMNVIDMLVGLSAAHTGGLGTAMPLVNQRRASSGNDREDAEWMGSKGCLE